MHDSDACPFQRSTARLEQYGMRTEVKPPGFAKGPFSCFHASVAIEHQAAGAAWQTYMRACVPPRTASVCRKTFHRPLL